MSKDLAAFLSQRPRLTNNRQRFISETVVDKHEVFKKLNTDDREAVIQFVTVRGVKDAVRESNVVQYLDLLADEKHIRHEDQVAISKNKCDMEVPFAGLPEDIAAKIVDQIEQFGHTKLINDATGQTDFMDSVSEIAEVMEDGSTIGDIKRREKALIMDSKIKDAMTDIYIASSVIIDEELYKELGHETARSYFNQIAISERKAYQYAVIGREMRPYAYLGDGKINPKTEKVAALGYSKLTDIVRYAKDQIDDLINKGELTIGGETMSQEDLENKTVRGLRRELKDAKEAKERALKAEQELKHARRSVDDLKADNEVLQKYQQEVANDREIREQLERASSSMADTIRYLRSIDTNKLDDTTAPEFVDRVNSCFDMMERLMQDNEKLFISYSTN